MHTSKRNFGGMEYHTPATTTFYIRILHNRLKDKGHPSSPLATRNRERKEEELLNVLFKWKKITEAAAH
jgi:hypothetical protein